VNRQFPIASSSEVGCRVGCKTATLSFYFRKTSQYMYDTFEWLFKHTFNMCKSVVFPALSKPRNSNLACLFKSPREARTSQTVGSTSASVVWAIDASRQECLMDTLSCQAEQLYLHQLTINILVVCLGEFVMSVFQVSRLQFERV